jgi:hypothetical protein
MHEKQFLLFTTHDESEFRVIGVRARYLDDAVLHLRQYPELAGCHTLRAVEVGDEEMVSLRHIYSATSATSATSAFPE